MLLSTQTSNLVGRFGFEEGVLKLHNAGYDCLDLSLFEMIRDDSVYVAENWQETVHARKRFADENDIIFNQSHVPFAFNWKDETVRNEIAFPRIEQALKISAMMGVKIAIVHPLHWVPYYGNEEELFRQNVEYYRGLIPIAKEYGVQIALENMWQREVKRRCICPSVAGFVEEHARYIDAIDSEWVVACLDVGHSSLVGEEAEDAIRVLGHDRLKALHVHDNDYQGDVHTIPGLGIMNWDNIMQALEDIRYDGEFTYEADAFLRNFKGEMLDDAVKFMVTIGRRLIAKTTL